ALGPPKTSRPSTPPAPATMVRLNLQLVEDPSDFSRSRLASPGLCATLKSPQDSARRVNKGRQKRFGCQNVLECRMRQLDAPFRVCVLWEDYMHKTLLAGVSALALSLVATAGI